jgi:hypothetical protein
MQQMGISGRPRWAVALTSLGGLLMVIGAILPFVTGSAGGPFEGQSLGGLDTPDGKLYLGVGIGLVVLAVLMWAGRSPALKKILGVLAILASGFMVYAGIVDISDVRDQAEVDIGTGLYVVLIASIIGVAGGVLSLISTESAREAPPPPVEPSTPPPITEPPSEPSSP